MTVEELIANFEMLAEAPDGVARLRELVLDLAVRGKLVPQDPTDPPASSLLGRRTVPAPNETALPAGWACSSLALLGDILGGGTPSKSSANLWQGTLPWVSPKDMKADVIADAQDHISEAAVAESSVRLIPTGALLMVVRGMILAHSFPTALTSVVVTINQDMKALVPFRDDIARYLRLLTRGEKRAFLALVERSTHGTCKLPSQALLSMPLPIPPLPEQHRIVAKVDELMSLLNRLDAARKARETARTASRDSALQALRDATTPDQVQTAWTRVANHLDDLITDPADIEPLRQTILQLAVRGRLVPQDPADVPAALTVVRPLGSNTESTSTEDHLPFAPPHGWASVRFGDAIPHIFTGPFGTSLKAAEYVRGGTPVINPQNMRDGAIVPTDDTCVGRDTLRRLSSFRVSERDIVVARRGELGRCAVVGTTEAGWLCGTGSLVLRPPELLNSHFAALFLRSPWTVTRLVGDSVGSTMNNLNQRIMVNLPFGLPPLAEQHRIVAKVDELMSLLDRLAERLRAVQDTQAAFAAAAVHHLNAGCPRDGTMLITVAGF